jgi:WD40 repeat protein
MSVCYHPKNFILFTGGHDGTLFGWHTETSSIKYHLHDQDPECIIKVGDNIDSMEGVKKSKSVDCLEIITLPE